MDTWREVPVFVHVLLLAVHEHEDGVAGHTALGMPIGIHVASGGVGDASSIKVIYELFSIPRLPGGSSLLGLRLELGRNWLRMS